MVEAQSFTKDIDEREYSEAEFKELTKLYESTLNSISERTSPATITPSNPTPVNMSFLKSASLVSCLRAIDSPW